MKSIFQKNVSDEEVNKLKKSMNINENKFIILLPGRLTYWKGQKVFYRGFKYTKQKKLT